MHTLSSLPTRLLNLLIAAALCLGTASVFAAATNAVPRAGWAGIEITPPPGIALGGRGVSLTASKRTLDPLFAQALLLEDGRGGRLAVVSLDLVGLTRETSDRLRQALGQALGIPGNLVLVNFSHTHSGSNTLRALMAALPPEPPEETAFFASLQEKVAQAARQAEKSLQPVTAEIFEGASTVAINRRLKNSRGKVLMQPNPDGPIAEKVWLLRLTPASGGPGALLFSYACHPVIVYGHDGAAFSADFPGATRRALRQALGTNLHAQFVQGPAGNVRPRLLADLAGRKFRGSRPEDHELAGRALATNILAALQTPGDKLALALAGVSDRPFLRRDAPPPRQQFETMAGDSKSTNHQAAARYWLERYDRGTGFARGDTWPAGLIQLDPKHWICWMSGEPVVEWGPKVAAWLPGRRVVLWGYTQESNTYLPVDEMLPEGGYEVLECHRVRASSPAAFAPGLNAAFETSLRAQAARLEALPAHPQPRPADER